MRVSGVFGAVACALVTIAATGRLLVAVEVSAAVQSPVSPQESLDHIVVPKGLEVELVAHEPNVIDPVAIRFDENGRMWVVEMRDYPTAGTTGNYARSRISILSDRDGDGFFETSKVFADDLPYATGVQPWKGGVFVTMAGQVAYMKDTNGDDRADVVETWYTGFAEENTQLRASHPQLALDNHIYVANGLRGGTIVDAQRADASPVSISGMDFRFDPLTRKFEAVSGVGQFGLSFDDYGNRFVCSNRNPAIHVVLEDRHLKKNPLAAVSAVSHDVAKAGAESRIFPITRAWTTSNLHAGQFTAACGLRVYRGDALPGEYGGNLFVCDPTGHLVHRELMKPHGVTFTSSPAVEGVEFFASRDDWCCPVNLEVGPDGAMYVVDMYRAIIEHPEWMPTELRERPNLVAGNDQGRIYRVVPQTFTRPPAPRLSDKSNESLVELLAYPNAWWRETAARLLLERQDKSVGAALERMALEQDKHLARIHAMWLLEGLHLLSDNLLQRFLVDPNPRIVEQAIVASESRIGGGFSELRRYIAKLVRSDEPRVRFQALLVAMPLPLPPAHPADSWELDAMRIAAGSRGGTFLATVLNDPKSLRTNVADAEQFVVDLARLAASSPNKGERILALDALLASDDFGRVGLVEYLSEAVRRRRSVESIHGAVSKKMQIKLARAFELARSEAANFENAEDVRCGAVDLLAFDDTATDSIASLARSDGSQGVRLRAIAALTKKPDVAFWRALLRGFSGETPVVRGAILDGLLSNVDLTELLLHEIGNGCIKPMVIDATRISVLLNHKEPRIKDRAAKLFADAVPRDREQALSEYRSTLSATADYANGREVFQKHCAACHEVGGIGVRFAPDISDSREKTAEQLLTDIIQPNRAIDSNYFSYTAIANDGRVHSGILAAETSTSVTLKQAEDKSVTLLRDDIEELRSDGVSFMPDGMEKNISPQEMADLIGFIKNWRYLESGSDRRTVQP